jgi:hypothetical protein
MACLAVFVFQMWPIWAKDFPLKRFGVYVFDQWSFHVVSLDLQTYEAIQCRTPDEVTKIIKRQ